MNLAQAPAQYDKTDQDRMRATIAGEDRKNIKTDAAFIQLPKYAKAALPAQATGGMIYVTDDVGGATPAFSDGTNWRRTADRNVIS